MSVTLDYIRKQNLHINNEEKEHIIKIDVKQFFNDKLIYTYKDNNWFFMNQGNTKIMTFIDEKDIPYLNDTDCISFSYNMEGLNIKAKDVKNYEYPTFYSPNHIANNGAYYPTYYVYLNPEDIIHVMNVTGVVGNMFKTGG